MRRFFPFCTVKMAAETEADFVAEQVHLWSDGYRLHGQLRLPQVPAAPLGGVVFTPGWLGLAESGATIRWLDALAKGGLAVLSFDYRGFGDSEGPRGFVRPDWQMEDIRNAVTFLGSRPEVDRHRIGMFGKGGTGGGNAVMAGALDDRVRCIVAQTPVADGGMWLRGMRREYEWREFLKRIEASEEARVTTGFDELVDPRQEIMVAAPERSLAPNKAAVDSAIGNEFHLSTAAHVLRYRPIDATARLRGRPVMLIGIEEDVVTPVEHARLLFDGCSAPRQLVVMTGVSHYKADERYFQPVSKLSVDWFKTYLQPRSAISSRDLEDDIIVTL